MVFCTLLFLSHAFADDRNEVSATLKTVTVYRSGAEMMHTAAAQLKAGSNEVIIDNISYNIDSNSIQIKAPSLVTILHFEFSNNYLTNTTRTQRALMLDDSLQRLEDGIEKLDASIANTKELLEVLKLNRDIKGQQNGLSVTELQKLMDYYAAKWTELQNTLTQQKGKRSKLLLQSGRVKEQIVEEEKKNTSTAGRLTLQLNAAMPIKADFTITYIARNAYWTPFYDVRADNIQQPVKLMYKAKVVQTTGIDWKAVKLSLSTASPSHSNNAPELASWFLGYVSPVVQYGYNNSLQGKVAGLSINPQSSLSEVVVTGYGSVREDREPINNYTPPKPVFVVNGTIVSDDAFQQIDPSNIKSMSKLKGNEAKARYGGAAEGGATVVELKGDLPDYIAISNQTLNATFSIDIPFDVPTNGKGQTATLQTVDAPTLFQHFSVPKLDDEVYLLAKFPAWESLNLLPGEANIILEGTYVGKTIINPNTTQDTFSLTLGQDKRVVIQRKKLADYSSVKFLGSNKLQRFTYEITVKNNKAEAVNLLAKDQYPVSTNKDIEVELNEANGATVNKETGLLSWQLSLQPNESKTLRFSYSIKYPKDRTINVYE